MTTTDFEGCFDFGWQETFLSLKVNSRFLYETNSNDNYKQATLTIEQLLPYNTTIRKRNHGDRNESTSAYYSRKL